MRISYSDDEEYAGQFQLWPANCRRSLESRKGQTALRELEAALLALPSKRLIADELDNGCDVCAVGALARYKATVPKADPEWDMTEVGVELGMPRLVAWKVVELNDIDLGHHWTTATADPEYGCGEEYIPFTPEERYKAVLRWVREQLA